MSRGVRALAVTLAVAAGAILGASPATAATTTTTKAKAKEPAHTVRAQDFRDLTPRPIGPANMGGRISDFAAVESDPATFYVGTATGGLFKTKNLGTTFQPVFDKQSVASIGAVAVWQKNPAVVWVGTGEANSRNSSSWGDGVYRSDDAGGSWRNVGLVASHSIARIVTHPADSNTVYVAALGNLWKDDNERGVFRTQDGGRTWTHVLRGDARTGAVDLVMDPSEPRTLYAALYARRRTPWSFESGSARGGIYRTRDGGATWTRLAGGLPERTGRIGLDLCRERPKVVVAVVESDEGGQIQTMEDKSRSGGVFRTEDGGESWRRTAPFSPRPFYFSQIRIQPDDDRRVYLLGFDLWISDDGGRTFRAGGGRNVHPDLHAMWINPARPAHLLLGTDGGVFQSHDRAATWDFLNQMALGEFYNIGVSMTDPYFVCGGLQDNQTWCGPVRTRLVTESWLDPDFRAGILNDHWFCLGGGDGFHAAIDPKNPDIVYYESQGASLRRLDLATGAERVLKPAAREGSTAYRFNWNSPFMLSPHDPTVLWLGGNHVFRLTERGDRWAEASPDLSTQNPARSRSAGSAAETHCTVVTLSESPVTAGVLWAGTDDGKVWVTRDAGAHWTDLTGNVRGVPRGLYVSRIEASPHDAASAIVSIDGHRTGDFGVWALATRDYGRTWRSIAGDLPRGGPVKVIRHGLGNPDLYFAGTEFGLYATLDGGKRWMKAAGLPTVAVDDLVIHPRERDLVIATHGRSLWVIDDIGALEQWRPDTPARPVTLFAPRPATAYHVRGIGGVWGQRQFSAKNPPFGASIDYFVNAEAGDGGESARITIADSAGTTVRTLTGSGSTGFHRVTWDLQREARERIERPEWGDQPSFLPAGTYRVTLALGAAKSEPQKLVVKHAAGAGDPDLPSVGEE